MFSRLRSNIVVLWIVRLLALPVIALLYATGFVLNLLYGICGTIGMILAGLGGFAAFLALLDGSYAQAAASALVALLLCPFAAPMLLSLAGSALIVAASALFAWLFWKQNMTMNRCRLHSGFSFRQVFKKSLSREYNRSGRKVTYYIGCNFFYELYWQENLVCV